MKLSFLVAEKKIVIILCLFVLPFLLLACSNKDSVYSEQIVSNSNLNNTDAFLQQLDTYTDKNNTYIAVLLAYGYNEGKAKENILAALTKEYGFVEDGGIIIPLIYPEDFISLGFERISLLPELIEEKLVEAEIESAEIALITLGAPEGTHRALAILEDAQIQGPVFSIFSQDDVLGTEAGSDLVIDYSPPQNKDSFATAKETNSVYQGDVFDVVAPLINAALNWEETEKAGMPISALRTEFLKRTSCNLLVYVDPQTNLRSKNHYVLEGIVIEEAP